MKIPHSLLLALLLPLCACAQGCRAACCHCAARPSRSPPRRSIAKDPRVAMAARIPGTKPEDLRATPVPGIYELTHGSDITYVSADGQFVFAGDMYQVSDKGEFPNLSENPSPRAAPADARRHARVADDRVRPGERQAHHHCVHRLRLPLVPAPAQPDRRVQQAGHPRALHVLSAHRSAHRVLGQGRSRVVRQGSQCRVHARQAAASSDQAALHRHTGGA